MYGVGMHFVFFKRTDMLFGCLNTSTPSRTVGPVIVERLPIDLTPLFTISVISEKTTQRSPSHSYISATCVIHIVFTLDGVCVIVYV